MLVLPLKAPPTALAAAPLAEESSVLEVVLSVLDFEQETTVAKRERVRANLNLFIKTSL